MQSVALHAGRVLFQSSGRTPSGFLQKCKKLKFLVETKIFNFLHFRKNPLVASAGGPRSKKHPPRMPTASHRFIIFLVLKHKKTLNLVQQNQYFVQFFNFLHIFSPWALNKFNSLTRRRETRTTLICFLLFLNFYKIKKLIF